MFLLNLVLFNQDILIYFINVLMDNFDTCFLVFTLPETNSLPLKNDGWRMSFLLGWYIFRCYVPVWGSVIQLVSLIPSVHDQQFVLVSENMFCLVTPLSKLTWIPNMMV